MKKIKLFVTDVDGTLTDSTVYVSETGEVMKQFSHRDGRGFYLLKERGCPVGVLTSEAGGINRARISKLMKLGTVTYFSDGTEPGDKLEKLHGICEKMGIDLKTEVAFIGDDTNDECLFNNIDTVACPADAHASVKDITGILVMVHAGGRGAVRDFIDYLLEENLV